MAYIRGVDTYMEWMISYYDCIGVKWGTSSNKVFNTIRELWAWKIENINKHFGTVFVFEREDSGINKLYSVFDFGI